MNPRWCLGLWGKETVEATFEVGGGVITGGIQIPTALLVATLELHACTPAVVCGSAGLDIRLDTAGYRSVDWLNQVQVKVRAHSFWSNSVGGQDNSKLRTHIFGKFCNRTRGGLYFKLGR